MTDRDDKPQPPGSMIPRGRTMHLRLRYWLTVTAGLLSGMITAFIMRGPPLTSGETLLVSMLAALCMVLILRGPEMLYGFGVPVRLGRGSLEERMKDWSELERLCAEPLDRANVKERRQAGSVLSYVDGYYVKRRLSEVFGVAGWSSSVTVLAQEGPAYQAESRSGNITHRVAYRCEVALTVRGRTGGVGGDPVRVLEVTKTDVGTGLGSAADLNEAREKAMKEAATDALKRAAALLGDSFGLALYDRSQANVEDYGSSDVPF
jgi:hypothetical protein